MLHRGNSEARQSPPQKLDLKPVTYLERGVEQKIEGVEMRQDCQSANNYVCATKKGRMHVAQTVCRSALNDEDAAAACIQNNNEISEVDSTSPATTDAITFENVKPDVCQRLNRSCSRAEGACIWDHALQLCGAAQTQIRAVHFGGALDDARGSKLWDAHQMANSV